MWIETPRRQGYNRDPWRLVLDFLSHLAQIVTMLYGGKSSLDPLANCQWQVNLGYRRCCYCHRHWYVYIWVIQVIAREM
jgi:hypothetical protein